VCVYGHTNVIRHATLIPPLRKLYPSKTFLEACAVRPKAFVPNALLKRRQHQCRAPRPLGIAAEWFPTLVRGVRQLPAAVTPRTNTIYLRATFPVVNGGGYPAGLWHRRGGQGRLGARWHAAKPGSAAGLGRRALPEPTSKSQRAY